MSRHAALPRDLAVISAALMIVVIAWFPGLLRGEEISVADALYARPPWEAQRPPGYRGPANKLLFDQVVQVYPWLDFARERLKRGELPLWNPYDLCGTAFLANQNAGVLSPFHLATLPAKTTATALTWIALLKVAVAATGAFLFARAREASRVAALGGAITFALGGQMIAWLGHPLTTSLPLFPFSLWLAERIATRVRPRRDAGVLAALTLVHMLGSHPETSLHIVLVTGVYAMFRTLGREGRGPRRLAMVVAAVSLGVVAASAQILPFADALHDSHPRQLRLNLGADSFRLPLTTLPLLWTPRAHGTPMELNHREDLAGGLNFAEGAVFAGVLPLVLIPALWPSLRARSSDRLVAALAVSSIVIAIDPGGVLGELIRRIPLVGLGAHHRLVFVWQLGLALLFARALDLLVSADAAISRVNAIVATVIAVVAVALTWWRVVAADAWSKTVAASLAFAVVVAFLGLAAVLLRGAATRRPTLARATLLALAFVDLWHFGRGVNPTLATELVFSRTPTTDFLAAAPTSRVIALDRALPANTGLPYHLHDVRGYEPLFRDDYQQWWSEVMTGRGAWDPVAWSALRATEVLPLLGVRYVVDAVSPTANDRGLRVAHSGDATVFEIDDPEPMAFIRREFDLAASVREAGARLREGYDFRTRVLLNRAPEPVAAEESSPPGPLSMNGEGGGADVLHASRPRAERIVLEVELASPAVVVANEAFDPGWRARIDGIPAPILRAYGVLMAVSVPAGRHEITFDYRPRTLDLGLALSALGVVAITLLVAWPARRE